MCARRVNLAPMPAFVNPWLYRHSLHLRLSSASMFRHDAHIRASGPSIPFNQKSSRTPETPSQSDQPRTHQISNAACQQCRMRK